MTAPRCRAGWLGSTVLLLGALLGLGHAMTKEERHKLRDQVLEMFDHAYQNYMDHAYPADELMPLTCRGRVRGLEPSRGDVDDALGKFSLTLIDTMDTLAVLNKPVEFEEAVRRVLRDVRLDNDIVVSVFETNIRVLGGLLGGHSMALMLRDGGRYMPWYQDELLSMAKELGLRLLPAFNTSSGLPYPRINLKHGLHSPESRTGTETDTCTACAGTMILEFAALSRFTGEPVFEAHARRALDFLWEKRQRNSNLVGTTINIHTGDWVRRGRCLQEPGQRWLGPRVALCGFLQEPGQRWLGPRVALCGFLQEPGQRWLGPRVALCGFLQEPGQRWLGPRVALCGFLQEPGQRWLGPRVALCGFLQEPGQRWLGPRVALCGFLQEPGQRWLGPRVALCGFLQEPGQRWLGPRVALCGFLQEPGQRWLGPRVALCGFLQEPGQRWLGPRVALCGFLQEPGQRWFGPHVALCGFLQEPGQRWLGPRAFTTDFRVHWGQHPLRPEFAESTYFLYKATGDPYYLETGKTILENLNKFARVPCGFAAMKDVRTGSHEDR
ncbi:UNVERIFIED_CONTAM: hypothetical protein FKN15_027681 [Acipenser sinensis]